DRNRRAWSQQRWGTAFNPVNGKRTMWQSAMNVVAPTGSDRAGEARRQPSLPPGAYLAKMYLDRERKMEKNPDHLLGEKEFIGQAEISGEWPPGYQSPQILDAAKFLKRD
ncbi:MAG: hypothetical protein N2C14_34170, partial [Planctomycetales bacterium]